MPIALVNADDFVSTGRALEELAAGRLLVGIPTETVYGLLADVRRPENVAYLRAAGAAPVTGPLAVHLGPAYPLTELVGPASAIFRRLVRKAWPGPLTILLEQPAEEYGPRLQRLAEEIKNEITVRQPDGSRAIQLRCPQGRWIETLLDSAAQGTLGPLVAIGLFLGNMPAIEAAEALQDLEQRNTRWSGVNRCNLVADAGRTRYAKPSTVIRVRQERWSLVRAGVWDERTVRRLARFSLLFVCTGNTCRSPMAAVLARQAVARKLGISMDELEARGIEINSAGVAAWEGQPASPQAVRVIRRPGLDLSRHRSRPLTATLVQGSDLVLVMTPGHRDEVIATFPLVSDKVRLLGDKAVMDPAGGSEEEYESIARELETMVTRLVQELDL